MYGPDYLAPTPEVGRDWCPTCEEDADPLLEILIVRYCSDHLPSVAGADDDAAGERIHLSSGVEPDPDTNRAMCRLIHRPEVRDDIPTADPSPGR